MKVYLVIESDYGGSTVKGAYRHEKVAEAEVACYEADKFKQGINYSGLSWWVDEHVVNEEEG
ncbi:MAG TPA: hypothetical protein VD994_02415 [Prosthecobacter sp.]|nr:hypothetical protein [Prosthecobacter sp.]